MQKTLADGEELWDLRTQVARRAAIQAALSSRPRRHSNGYRVDWSESSADGPEETADTRGPDVVHGQPLPLPETDLFTYGDGDDIAQAARYLLRSDMSDELVEAPNCGI